MQCHLLLYDEEGWVRDEGQVYDDEAGLSLFNLILKCNQTLTKHSLSKDRTQGKEGHDGAEVQVLDEEDKVHYGDHVRDEDEQVRDGGQVCDHGEDLIPCGIVVNLCSFSSKPRRPKRLASPFCKPQT